MIKKHTFLNREEWLKHRNGYIGGSEAAAVMGLSPWMSNVDLWMQKTGKVAPKDISDSPNVTFGIKAEPIIRELFKLDYPQYEVHYEDFNSWTNDKYPFAAVSHDGWLTDKETGRKGIWECKTTEIVSSMAKEKWNDKIPMSYYCQLLHCFIVREDCEFAHLTALLTWRYDDKELYQQLKNYHVERSDVQSDIDILARKESEFWENVKSGRCPSLILPEI